MTQPNPTKTAIRIKPLCQQRGGDFDPGTIPWITVGCSWFPARLNGLWLALVMWWQGQYAPTEWMLAVRGASFQPPRWSSEGWRVLHRYRLDGNRE